MNSLSHRSKAYNTSSNPSTIPFESLGLQVKQLGWDRVSKSRLPAIQILPFIPSLYAHAFMPYHQALVKAAASTSHYGSSPATSRGCESPKERISGVSIHSQTKSPQGELDPIMPSRPGDDFYRYLPYWVKQEYRKLPPMVRAVRFMIEKDRTVVFLVICFPDATLAYSDLLSQTLVTPDRSTFYMELEQANRLYGNLYFK